LASGRQGGKTARIVAIRLKAIVAEVAKETAYDILELEVMPDHAHLLCEVDPQFGIAKFVRLVKGRTSHHLRREFPQLRSRLPTLWTKAEGMRFVAVGQTDTLNAVRPAMAGAR
jgi:putative transposase